MAISVGINRRAEERQVIAERAIIEAIALPMSKEVKSLFDRIIMEYKKFYSLNGFILQQEEYRKQWELLLEKYYKKTAQKFTKLLRTPIEDLKYSVPFLEVKAEDIEIEQEEEQDINTQIAIATGIWINKQKEKQATEIIKTTQKDLSFYTNKAQEILMKEDIDYRNSDVATIASKKYNEITKTRSNLISDQEISMTAEASKQIEAQAISESDASIIIGGGAVAIGSLMKKTWNASLDGKTRKAHASADFVYHSNPIGINEYFIVNGEMLQRPKDPNGSPGNIINCRCSAITIIAQ